MERAPGQFSFRAIFVSVAVVAFAAAVVIGGYLALGRAAQKADHQARIQAIRNGDVPLKADEVTPREYDVLKAELDKKH
jgi:hypothetical protein